MSTENVQEDLNKWMDLEAKESAALREIGQEQALMREEQHGKLAGGFAS